MPEAIPRITAGKRKSRAPTLWLIGGLYLAGLLSDCTGVSAATPELGGGTWEPIDPPQAVHTLEGKLPPLLPAAAEVYRQHLEARQSGMPAFDTTEKCLPPGTPRLLYMGPFEVAQQSKQVTFLYQWNRLVRTVPMNVPQPEVPGPSYEGQSVGKWINGALQVDTIGFLDSTTLDAAGLPHSEALHVTETYRPSSDGQHMRVRITIEDPKTYAKSWSTELHFRRNPSGEIHEDYCLERKGIQWGHLRQTGIDIKEGR